MIKNQTNEGKRDETLAEIRKLTQCPLDVRPPQGYINNAMGCCHRLCDSRKTRDSGESSDSEVEELEKELDEYLKILWGYGKDIDIARKYWKFECPGLWEKLGFQ